MSDKQIKDDDIENLLLENQVIINDRFDPVLKSVKFELGTGDELELDQDDTFLTRKSRFFENGKFSISPSGMSRIFAIQSSITTILIWWIRHTPGERMILNTSAICGEQAVLLVASLFFLKTLTKTSLLQLIYHHETLTSGKTIYNHKLDIQVVIGSILTLLTQITYWIGLGHLDIVMSAVVWESRSIFESCSISILHWYGMISNSKSLKLTCSQWFGILLFIFALIILERMNRMEGSEELFESNHLLSSNLTSFPSSSLSSSSSSSTISSSIDQPLTQINIEKEEEAKDITAVSYEGTHYWESTHHEGFATLFSAAILFVISAIHTHFQVLENTKIAGDIHQSENSNPQLPLTNISINQTNFKKHDKKELLIVLWSYIFKRSILTTIISFLLSLYLSKGNFNIVFQGYDMITSFIILLNGIGSIFLLGFCIDLFSPIVLHETINHNEKKSNNYLQNINIENKLHIQGSGAGISMMITLVITSLFLGSSGLHPKILIGIFIAIYGAFLHGKVLGGQLPIDLFALSTDDDESASISEIRNGEFVVGNNT